jgi:hypothetical protein
MRTRTRHLLAAALAAPCLAGATQGQALAQGQASLHHLPQPAGTGRLVLPGGNAVPVPLVIILPDALGDEGRSEPYVQALEGRGIATLVLGLDGDPDLPQAPADPAASAEAAVVARAWAVGKVTVFQGGAIGVLGLGAGGRAALADANGGPAVALYPGCSGLELPAWRPALLLHGLDAHDAAACAGLAEPPAATILGLPGFGHAWDVRAGAWGQGDMLPDPAFAGRVTTQPDAEGTQRVAERVAAWLAQQLAERQAGAR